MDNKIVIQLKSPTIQYIIIFTQFSKLIYEIPKPDIAISMGCNVTCPFIGRAFDDDWQLEDPTGKSDEEFIKIIKEIEKKILELKAKLNS